LELQQTPFLEGQDGKVAAGVLCCQCCAYPIVAGIPYLRTGPLSETAMSLLGAGEPERALFTLLGLEETKWEQFERLLSDQHRLTFQDALETLDPTAEGTYLLYRFSDPTFLTSRAVLRAVGQDRRCLSGPILDVCGGAGHLTRSLSELAGPNLLILADISFWKLWLAKRFVAPQCQPLCCDANQPLPFAKESFSLVHCSDAFHYIWSRRLLANEMVRLVGDHGVVILSHVHNALCWNYSEGMPLTPAGYRNLFDDFSPRLFKESVLLDGLLHRRSVDLSVENSDKDLEDESAFVLITTRLPGLFRRYELPDLERVAGVLAINPLYDLERNGEGVFLRLRSPSPEYDMEYDVKGYLPDRLELSERMLESLVGVRLEGELKALAEQHVLLDVPAAYLRTSTDPGRESP
jgi:SAM-dependent methyltransferase